MASRVTLFGHGAPGAGDVAGGAFPLESKAAQGFAEIGEFDVVGDDEAVELLPNRGDELRLELQPDPVFQDEDVEIGDDAPLARKQDSPATVGLPAEFADVVADHSVQPTDPIFTGDFQNRALGEFEEERVGQWSNLEKIVRRRETHRSSSEMSRTVTRAGSTDCGGPYMSRAFAS